MSVYMTVGARDLEHSAAFYGAVLATIGWYKHKEYPGWKIYSEGGAGGSPVLSLGLPFDGKPASAGNGAMIGFFVPTRAEVDAFHATALAKDGSDEGPPGLRSGYGPTWYSAYVRDPVGNKLAVVCNR